MDQIYNINTSVLRYVIPFHYLSSYSDTIETIEQQTAKNGIGKAWLRESVSWPESNSDLYEYIKNEALFSSEDSVISEDKTGYRWICSDSGTDLNMDSCLLHLQYHQNSSSGKKTDLDISSAGIILYHTGIGFFWYEIKICNSDFNSDDLIVFQNRAKELNDGRRHRYFYNYETQDVFSFGLWISNTLSFLNIKYFAERTSSLDPTMTIPDKVLLFTYCSFITAGEDTKLSREKLSYYITNGFNESFYYSEDTAREMKYPFSNVIWYSTREGASILAWPGLDNESFFNGFFPKRIKGDYFSLFLKVLCQSYSMLLYAQKVQDDIHISDIRSSAHKLSSLVEEINLFLAKNMATSVSYVHHQSEFYVYLKAQMHVHDDIMSVTAGLDALNNMISDQRHVEENKRIVEEWHQTRERDNAARQEREKRELWAKHVEEAEQKRDNQIQAIMGLFTLLGVFSALVDCYDFIDKFVAGGEWSQLSALEKGREFAGFGLIAIVVAFTIPFAFKAIIQAFSKDQK